MRAKMLFDARIIGDPDRLFTVGQEIDGADAELQVGLGHAEEIADESAAAKKGAKGGDPTKLAPGEQWDATQGALDHAKATGVDVGTGAGGTVTKADVSAAADAKKST